MSCKRKVNAVVRCALSIIVLALAFDCHAGDPNLIRVALYKDKGIAGGGISNVTTQLGKIGDIKMTQINGKQIANGELKDFDVVIFTGGMAGQQYKSLDEKGPEEVRKFVQNGGGYVGICAGAYLACSGSNQDCKTALGILNATTASKWQRTRGRIDVELTPPGQQIAILPGKMQKVVYAHGPIFSPAEQKDLPPFEILAFYRSEVSGRGSEKGNMINTPAIVRANYGQGRVLASSPHPEATVGMESFIEQAVRWTAEKENKGASDASDPSKLNKSP
jgi:glutamine amidotransferase-like uncharacterized protein